MPKRLWLTVEDAFVANGRGVLVEPKFVPQDPPKGTFAITLKTPSGDERALEATLDFAHSRGGLPPFAMLRVFEVKVEDLPKGSEIWIDA